MGTILDTYYKLALLKLGTDKLDIHPEINSLEVAPPTYGQNLIYSPYYLNLKFGSDSLISAKS